MAAPIQSPDKCKVHSIIVSQCKRWTSSGHSQTNCCCLWWCYESAKCEELVLWILQREDLCYNKQRSGRPSLICDEFLQKTEWEICANLCRMIREFHQIIPKVSKTTIHEAVTQKLGYRKLCALLRVQNVNRWSQNKTDMFRAGVPHTLAQEGYQFLDSIVTGDETWGFHQTPESKQQSLRCKKK
jgi:hypothetical protein